jgi:hypothetical protein
MNQDSLVSGFPGLEGCFMCPDARSATLVIGRTAGPGTRGRTTGDFIPFARAVEAIMIRRRTHVGDEAADASVIASMGYYDGRPGQTTRVCINWVRTRKEATQRAFDRNIRRLAQQVAGDLSQREVLVEWRAPGRRIQVDRVKPSTPTKPKRGASWISAAGG